VRGSEYSIYNQSTRVGNGEKVISTRPIRERRGVRRRQPLGWSAPRGGNLSYLPGQACPKKEIKPTLQLVGNKNSNPLRVSLPNRTRPKDDRRYRVAVRVSQTLSGGENRGGAHQRHFRAEDVTSLGTSPYSSKAVVRARSWKRDS